MRIHRLIAVTLMATASGAALAWGPYGPGPYGYPAPVPVPYPFAPPPGPPNIPFGPPDPMDLPLDPLAPPEDLAEGGPQTPGAAPAISLPRRTQLSISRRATDRDYLIEVRLANVDPEQVQIVPEGRGLRIAYRIQAQDYLEDGSDAGYRHGYSFVRGSTSRHLSLPPDANLSAMSREVTTDRILLRIPRADLGPSTPWPSPSPLP